MPAHRIVAIDFDSQIGERLRTAFAPPEFDFHWFGGGIEALGALHNLQPDVIVCDVMLPDIDGRAVLDAVRRSPTLRDVPFLVLSGTRSETTIRATLDAGADAFLLKPFPISQLVQTVRKVLKDEQPAAPAAERPPATGPVPSAVARASREAATVAATARAPAGEAMGRQRIGFETRDSLLEPPRLETAAVPSTGDPWQGRPDAGPQRRESVERAVAAPIRVEGRISSFDLDGSRVRIVTEAEQGHDLVVRTTLARDGKELRRVETTVDQPLDGGDLDRSLKELIDLQHASALQQVSRLAKPATARREAPPSAVEPDALASGERTIEPTPPPARLDPGEQTPPAAPEFVLLTPERPKPRASRRRGTGAAKQPAPTDTPAPAPISFESTTFESTRAPIPLEAFVLERNPAAAAAPTEQDFVVVPEPHRAVTLLEPIDSGSRRVWLAVIPVLLLVALALLLRGPFGAATAVRTPPPSPTAPAPVPEEALAAPTTTLPPTAPPPEAPPPTADPAERPSERPQTARASRPSQANLERLVRGRREWAQALYDAGRYEEARVALDEVFKLAPVDLEARRLLAQILRTPRGVASPGAVAPRPRETQPAAGAASGSSDMAPRSARPAAAQPPPTYLVLPDLPSRPEVRPGTLVTLDSAGVIAPRAEHKPPLAYPPMALRQKAEGTVELRALVDETGVVAEVRIVTGSATRGDLNAAAVEHVRTWTFRPATKSGVPVKVWLPVSVEFRLPK